MKRWRKILFVSPVRFLAIPLGFLILPLVHFIANGVTEFEWRRIWRDYRFGWQLLCKGS